MQGKSVDEDYINSLKQQTKNVEEQCKLLDELFNDYLLEKKLRIGYCDSLKNIFIYYYGSAHLWYESILHKFGYGNTKEE